MADRPTEFTCQWCGTRFTHLTKKGPRPKWCKPSCRQAAYYERRVKSKVDDLLAEVADLRSRLSKYERL